MQNARNTAWIFVLIWPLLCSAAAHRVNIDVGDRDRVDTIVAFPTPKDVADGTYDLANPDGSALMQVHGGQGYLFAHHLQANSTLHINLLPAAAKSDIVAVSREGGVAHVKIGDKAVFDYQGEKTAPPPGVQPVYQRGGYINQILTPSGLRVDDDYPLNHKHHHGIWSVWTKTEFEGRHPDFWNMGDKTGTSEPRGFKDLFSGPVAAGFHAEHQMIDLSAKPPKPAINEQWDVIAYAAGSSPRPYYLFDIIVHQQCAGESPLVLPKYHYGGMGFRGATEWNGIGKYTFLTSEGLNVKNGNGTRARWCYTGGTINGKPAGITIFCGPDSFRAPQPVRLNPDQPFFCYAPPAMGEFSIAPGTPYYARYRFLVVDGEPDKELIERVWNDYANPVKVVVE